MEKKMEMYNVHVKTHWLNKMQMSFKSNEMPFMPARKNSNRSTRDSFFVAIANAIRRLMQTTTFFHEILMHVHWICAVTLAICFHSIRFYFPFSFIASQIKLLNVHQRINNVCSKTLPKCFSVVVVFIVVVIVIINVVIVRAADV